MKLSKPLPILGRRKITPKVIKEVEDALKQVNGRSTAHVISSYDYVLKLVQSVIEDLKRRGVPVKEQDGIIAHYRPDGPGKTYARKAHKVNSTEIVIERINGTWCLTEIVSIELHSVATSVTTLKLPDDAILSLLRAALAGVHDLRYDSSKGFSPDLAYTIVKVAKLLLPGHMSAHAKLNALQVVDDLIKARNNEL